MTMQGPLLRTSEGTWDAGQMGRLSHLKSFGTVRLNEPCLTQNGTYAHLPETMG